MTHLEEARRATDIAAQRRAELTKEALASATRRLFAGLAAVAALERVAGTPARAR
ncbi:MAG: hypothetical protein H6719_32170 [Sandaracinaceae bacterium]|nr:hypothetical protein [Sandaracinaceae bacterium]